MEEYHPVGFNTASIPHYRCIDFLRRIVPRDEWGAAPPREKGVLLRSLKHPVPSIVFSFTMTEPCYNYDDCKESCRNIQKAQMEEGLPDISFNFMIGDDLNVYEGRGWNIEPETPNDWKNDEEKRGRILQIAYIGMYGVERVPPPEVLHVRDALAMYGYRNNYLDVRYFRPLS